MRIQFTVSNEEWEKLKMLAKKSEYPDVSSYCRDIALGDRNYQKLWQRVVDSIKEMQGGSVFALRDIVNNPPANLGRKLFENQKYLGIEIQKKDVLKSNTFKKL